MKMTNIILTLCYVTEFNLTLQGRLQDFKLGGGGAHLKELRRTEGEGGANIFGVFRVKNHDFTPKNLIFSNFRGGARLVRPPPGYATDNDSLIKLYAFL